MTKQKIWFPPYVGNDKQTALEAFASYKVAYEKANALLEALILTM
jgi:hypothetical protein